jgi:DNA-binding transcriptional MerR regulator
MKVSELSQRSGIPVATLKYYLREGLLPPGERTASNQASYGESHLRRLRLIRILQDVGGLRLDAIHEVTRLLDEPGVETMTALGAALDAQGKRPPEREAIEASDAWIAAAREVDAFLEQVGWPTRSESTARKRLIEALLALRESTPDLPVTAFFPYVRAAGEIAQGEVAHVMGALEAGPAEAVEAVVMGTVLWEPVFTSLRRIAHEQLSRRVLRSAQPQQPRPKGQGQDTQQ